MIQSSYAALWCKSYGSFLEGASSPEELVETAQKLGLAGLAVTDRDGLYAVVAAHTRAKELGLPLLIGSQVTLTSGPEVVVLVETHRGYRTLCRLLSRARQRCPKGQSRLELEELCQQPAGLLVLTTADPIPEALRQAFVGSLYRMHARHRLSHEQIPPAIPGIPRVAVNEVLYHQRQRRPLQDILTCIRHKKTLTGAGRLLKPNAEYVLHPPADFRQLFSDCPEDVAETLAVLERCRFSLDQLRYVYPAQHLAPGSSVQGRLEELAWNGAKQRYPQGLTAQISSQLHKELAVIAQLDYGGYFLTLYDLVEFCRRENILCQGRGSAANSIVCFCLGITAVDPIKLDLLFERFLSVERAEPPDIDLDIAHHDREKVIQYVYRLHGRDRAAMVANLVRYRPRSAMRDVGKALGIDPLQIERIVRSMSHYQETPVEHLQALGLEPEQPLHRHWLELSATIQGFPRHLSIHPGGFLLGHEPICELVPIENASMPGRTVIQWDKRDIEALGLFKVDLLGLGALSLLQECFDLLGRKRDIYSITAQDDPATWDMLARADTIGTFQVESRAQMCMLTRLQPRNFYDLVIQISIVRPGPIAGDMVHPYLRRRQGLEAIDYPHPALQSILRKTLGVPLFQEQVIRLAMVAADYSGGEADQLRRDMGAWKSTSKIENHRQRLVSAMLAKGIPQDFAERVFEQIRGFGEYGFPESHAASFALIAYATCYLKCNHPSEFCCALLNSQPMGFYSPLSIIQDARRRHLIFRPIDIAHSQWNCTLEPADDSESPAIRMGLRYVKGLDQAAAQRIIHQRGTGYPSLTELARRAQLDRRQLKCLAQAGALQSLGSSRRGQLWTSASLKPSQRDLAWLPEEVEPELPPLSSAEQVLWDCRYSAHSLQGHPLSHLRWHLESQGIVKAEQLAQLPARQSVRYVGLVICRQRPETAKGITFFTLEDETGLVNLIVKPEVYQAHYQLAQSASLLGVQGRLERQERVIHLIAQSFFPAPGADQLPRLASRDFH